MAQVVKVLKVLYNSDYSLVEWNDNGHLKYVACWGMMVKENGTEHPAMHWNEGTEALVYWGQGHYFQNLDDAAFYAYNMEKEAIEGKIVGLEQELKDLLPLALSPSTIVYGEEEEV